MSSTTAATTKTTTTPTKTTTPTTTTHNNDSNNNSNNSDTCQVLSPELFFILNVPSRMDFVMTGVWAGAGREGRERQGGREREERR